MWWKQVQVIRKIVSSKKPSQVSFNDNSTPYPIAERFKLNTRALIRTKLIIFLITISPHFPKYFKVISFQNLKNPNQLSFFANGTNENWIVNLISDLIKFKHQCLSASRTMVTRREIDVETMSDRPYSRYSEVL